MNTLKKTTKEKVILFERIISRMPEKHTVIMNELIKEGITSRSTFLEFYSGRRTQVYAQFLVEVTEYLNKRFENYPNFIKIENREWLISFEALQKGIKTVKYATS